MRFKLIAIFLLITLFGGAIFYDQYYTSSSSTLDEIFEPAPDISFTTLNGQKTKSLHDLKEDTLLINFWASWCTPCIKEFPAMIKKVKQSKGRIGLVAISIDETPAAAQAFIDEHIGEDVKHVYWVWDEGKELSSEQFGVVKVPETVVVDKNRKIVEKIIGEADFSKY